MDFEPASKQDGRGELHVPRSILEFTREIIDGTCIPIGPCVHTSNAPDIYKPRLAQIYQHISNNPPLLSNPPSLPSLKLMPLPPIPHLGKLLLRHATHKPLQPRQHLLYPSHLHPLPLRPPNQLLDPQQTLPHQMPPKPLLNLPDHRPLKPLLPLDIKNFIHKPHPHQVLNSNPPTHNQRLVRKPHA